MQWSKAGEGLVSEDWQLCVEHSVGVEAGAQNQAKLVSWAEIASQGANQAGNGKWGSV